MKNSMDSMKKSMDFCFFAKNMGKKFGKNK